VVAPPPWVKQVVLNADVSNVHLNKVKDPVELVVIACLINCVLFATKTPAEIVELVVEAPVFEKLQFMKVGVPAVERVNSAIPVVAKSPVHSVSLIFKFALELLIAVLFNAFMLHLNIFRYARLDPVLVMQKSELVLSSIPLIPTVPVYVAVSFPLIMVVDTPELFVGAESQSYAVRFTPATNVKSSV
jgi:hypothetical protein